MDRRTEKTEEEIRNAFLELRSHKELEKITVKELCEKARINKSTFYDHYSDIYALSNMMEEETIHSILDGIAHSQSFSLTEPEQFTQELLISFLAHTTLIELLFSGREEGHLSSRIESGIREMIYEKYPAFREDKEISVILSFLIQGAYHAFNSNKEVDSRILVSTVSRLSNEIGHVIRQKYGYSI